MKIENFGRLGLTIDVEVAVLNAVKDFKYKNKVIN